MSENKQNRFLEQMEKLILTLPAEHREKLRKHQSNDAYRQPMLNANLQLPYTVIPKPLSSPMPWKSE